MKILSIAITFYMLFFLAGCYEIENAMYQEEIQQTIDCLDLDESRIKMSRELMNSINFLESNEDDYYKYQMVIESIDLISNEQDRITNCTEEISSFARLEMWQYGSEYYEIDLDGIRYIFESFLFDEKFLATEESIKFIKEKAKELKNRRVPKR